ncbi:MAG TPA: DUF551 domain-containing protein [Ohtaekwangia sp.]|nr:DUF551 domain-containing protein [Ohtaekwangia sp.]
MKWISNQLPKTDTDVLVLLDDETILMGRWVNDRITRGHHWELYWQEGLKHIAPSRRNVTHWMPLPELPQP